MKKQELEKIFNNFTDAEYELDCYLKLLSELEEYYFLDNKEELGDKFHFMNIMLKMIHEKIHNSMNQLDLFLMKVARENRSNSIDDE